MADASDTLIPAFPELCWDEDEKKKWIANQIKIVQTMSVEELTAEAEKLNKEKREAIQRIKSLELAYGLRKEYTNLFKDIDTGKYDGAVQIAQFFAIINNLKTDILRVFNGIQGVDTSDSVKPKSSVTPENPPPPQSEDKDHSRLDTAEID